MQNSVTITIITSIAKPNIIAYKKNCRNYSTIVCQVLSEIIVTIIKYGMFSLTIRLACRGFGKPGLEGEPVTFQARWGLLYLAVVNVPHQLITFLYQRKNLQSCNITFCDKSLPGQKLFSAGPYPRNLISQI